MFIKYFQAIVAHFYEAYRTSTGPVFAVSDNICPVVTTEQNFDSMLIPQGKMLFYSFVH